MAGLKPIKVVAYFQVWHAHHPLHQLLAMGVETLATLEGFDQQLKQLSFGGCAGHGLLLSSYLVVCQQHRKKLAAPHHSLGGVVCADSRRRLPHLRGLDQDSPLNVSSLLGIE